MNSYYIKFKNDLSEIGNYIWSDYLDHEDSHLIEEAILLLIKEGKYRDGMELNRFFSISGSRLSIDDLLFFINNKLVILKKIDKEKLYSLVHKINNDVISIYSEYFLKIAIFYKDAEFLKKVFDLSDNKNYYSLTKKDSRFLIDTIKVSNIIKDDSFKDNLELIEHFTIDEMDLILDREDIFFNIELDNFIQKENSINFLKKYIKHHMLNNSEVNNEDQILAKINESDSKFVSDLILKTKNKKHISFLNEDFDSIEDIVMESGAREVSEYLEKNIQNLTAKQISKIYNNFFEIVNLLFGTHSFINTEFKDYIISHIKTERFIETINYELSFSKSDYFIENYIINAIENNISLDKFFIESTHFGSKLKNIDKFISFKNHNINKMIIQSDVELREDQSLMILENQLSEDNLLLLLLHEQIKGNKALEISFKENFNLELISEVIFENKISISDKNIKILLENGIEVNSIIDFCVKKEINLDQFNWNQYLDKINQDNITILFDKDIIDLIDIEPIDNNEINSFLFRNDNFSVNEKTLKRKVLKEDIDFLIDKIEEENKENLIPFFIQIYSSEIELIEIIESIQFKDCKDIFLKEILTNHLNSKIFYKILYEIGYKDYMFSYRTHLNSSDLRKVVAEKINIPSSFFTERYNEISSFINSSEDSKGVSLFLPNYEFIITYSTYRNKFKNSSIEYSDEDFVVFQNIINQINANPKRLKAKVYKDLSFNILVKGEEIENSEFEISNLEEIRKWFIFFEKDNLVVDLVRNCNQYEISFGKMKSKKESTMEFVNQVRKLDISQIDNLIQNYKNFNPKRPYGIECEFSIQMDDYKYHEEESWSSMEKEDLINYIENNHIDAIENKYIDRNDNLEELKYGLQDYFLNNEMITYNSNDEFKYLESNFKKIIKEKDKKHRKSQADMNNLSSDGSFWHLKTDESVDDSEYGRLGIEIASPKLYGKSDLNIFKNIMKKFIYNNVDSDDMSVYNAGVHVHHDVNDIEDSQKVDLSNLKKELLPMQEMLFGIVESSRRDNSYCKKYDYDDIFYPSDHQDSINFSTGKGTVEFRMKEGTTSVEDIANWVVLTHEITDKICKNLINKSIKSLEKKKTLFDKIMLNAQSVYERNIISKSEVEDLFEMYNIAKNF